MQGGCGQRRRRRSVAEKQQLIWLTFWLSYVILFITVKQKERRMKLKPLDIVRTRHGTVAVVSEVSSDGSVSLVLPARSEQKYAWYKPSELDYISSLQGLMAQIG